MAKVLIVSDDPIPSGFGRISCEINTRLVKRGFEIMVASLTYDGLLPPHYDGQSLPYHIAAMNGKPNWPEIVVNLVNIWQPDLIHVTQDFPYSESVRYSPLDWSKYGFVITTPVDGAPIYPKWVALMKQADAGLTISEFGVEQFRKQGVAVSLCRPSVNFDKFFPLPAEQRLAIRQKLGLAPDAFVVGSFCMNQGRKAISTMVECFYEFAQDKPNARYLLDMDKASSMGWDILGMIVEPNGWDASKLIFREDCLRAGIFELRERYNCLDAHMVIAHREGFGLPLSEARACGVVSMAMDYCSGMEVCGDGKGLLIKVIHYDEIGTWGGARERFVDKGDLVTQLNWLYDNPAERAAIAKRGMEAERQHTWDAAANAVQEVYERVLEKRKLIMAVPITQSIPVLTPILTIPTPAMSPLPPAVQVQPDGVHAVESIEVTS